MLGTAFPKVCHWLREIDGGGDHTLEFAGVGLEAGRGLDPVGMGDRLVVLHDIGQGVGAVVLQVCEDHINEFFGVGNVVFVGNEQIATFGFTELGGFDGVEEFFRWWCQV